MAHHSNLWYFQCKLNHLFHRDYSNSIVGSKVKSSTHTKKYRREIFIRNQIEGGKYLNYFVAQNNILIFFLFSLDSHENKHFQEILKDKSQFRS